MAGNIHTEIIISSYYILSLSSFQNTIEYNSTLDIKWKLISACRRTIVYCHKNWSSLNIVSVSQSHLVVVISFVGPIVIHRSLLMIAYGGVVDDFSSFLIMISRLWKKNNIRIPYKSLVLFDCITFLS
jgi:hypothetical protein